MLARIAAADPGREVFAAFRHGYELNPPVDAATLARAEQAIGARLPEEYRWFVTEVGDGGAGPYYGVLPLGAALSRLETALGSLDSLGHDCPLESDVDFGELIGQPDDWDEHLARLESDPSYEARFGELSQKYSDVPWLHGRLPIVDYGCGAWFSLVVRGPRRGTVWLDSSDDSTGLYCLEVDFMTLYRRWLDDALAEATTGTDTGQEASYGFLKYGDNPRYNS